MQLVNWRMWLDWIMTTMFVSMMVMVVYYGSGLHVYLERGPQLVQKTFSFDAGSETPFALTDADDVTYPVPGDPVTARRVTTRLRHAARSGAELQHLLFKRRPCDCAQEPALHVVAG
jgi:hypothetical protein